MKKEKKTAQKKRLRQRRRRERRRHRAFGGVSIDLPKASVAKFGEHSPNEDFATGDGNYIALSDGAGGCGLYADRWSRYLVEHIDKKHPISSFEQLDNWVGEVWEPFYNKYEAKAKEGDAMLLNKFYNEGACATLVVAWLINERECHWMAYGDSLLFHYDKSCGELWHSFTQLGDFDHPPHLISCKDPLVPEGFKSGDFDVNEGSVIFACSDALSQFILMMYQVSKWSKYQEELEMMVQERTSASQMIQVAREIEFDFDKDILAPLIQASKSDRSFAKLMRKWYEQGLMELDDYTVVFLTVH